MPHISKKEIQEYLTQHPRGKTRKIQLAGTRQIDDSEIGQAADEESPRRIDVVDVAGLGMTDCLARAARGYRDKLIAARSIGIGCRRSVEAMAEPVADAVISVTETAIV